MKEIEMIGCGFVITEANVDLRTNEQHNFKDLEPRNIAFFDEKPLSIIPTD